MRKIYSAEGLDESTARLVVAQEQVHGRYVEVQEAGGRWTVTVYLPRMVMTSEAPGWLRRAWTRDDPAKEDDDELGGDEAPQAT